MVSVLHKELDYKANKFKYKNLEVMQRDQKQIRIHQPRSVHTQFYSRHWSIKTVFVIKVVLQWVLPYLTTSFQS